MIRFRRWIRPSTCMLVVGLLLAPFGILTHTDSQSKWVMVIPWNSYFDTFVMLGLLGFLIGLSIEFLNWAMRDVDVPLSLSERRYGWALLPATVIMCIFIFYQSHASEHTLNHFNSNLAQGLTGIVVAQERLTNTNLNTADANREASFWLAQDSGALLAMSGLSQGDAQIERQTTSLGMEIAYMSDVFSQPTHYTTSQYAEVKDYILKEAAYINTALFFHQGGGRYIQHPRQLQTFLSQLTKDVPDFIQINH